MIITRRSPLSNKEWSMEIDMTEDEFVRRARNWEMGQMIQDVFPEFSADIREFIMTGIHPTEWDTLFGE